jgi:hypothetical protein
VEDLILRTRLGILEQNLEKVQGMMRAAQQRRLIIDALTDHLFGDRTIPGDSHDEGDRNIRQSLQDLAVVLNGLMPLLENELDDVHGGDEEADFALTLQRVRQALKYVEAAQRRLRRAQFTVGRMRRRFFQIDNQDLVELNSFITPDASKAIGKIKELQAQLDQVGDSQGTAMQQAWSDYATLLQTGQPLFTEYVDLWGGLALRDMNFDEGVCQMADEIIDKCNMVAGNRIRHSLAIPARAEATRMTLARIIRLGFPEWTLWAVPLAGHEFGHVIAARLAESSSRLLYADNASRSRYGRRYLDDLFADVFATYALGPAYACAAVLMRLDPRRAFEDVPWTEGIEVFARPAHAKRAFIILNVLERMDAKYTGFSAFGKVTSCLRDAWEAALKQVEQPGQLEDEQRAELTSLVRFMVEDFLEVYASGVEYGAEQWASRAEWPEMLNINGGAKLLKPKLEGDEQLRDVLNAAWLSRVTQADANVARIGHEAQALWEDISSPYEGAGGPRNRRLNI